MWNNQLREILPGVEDVNLALIGDNVADNVDVEPWIYYFVIQIVFDEAKWTANVLDKVRAVFPNSAGRDDEIFYNAMMANPDLVLVEDQMINTENCKIEEKECRKIDVVQEFCFTNSYYFFDVTDEAALEEAKADFSSDFEAGFESYRTNATISSENTVNFYETNFNGKFSFEVTSITDVSEKVSTFQSKSNFNEAEIDGPKTHISGQTAYKKRPQIQ